MSHHPSARPDHSPWGAIQTAEQIHPGIWHLTTASHGGFILSEARQAAMPQSLVLPHIAYEEDVDYALVVLAFASEFEAIGGSGALLVKNAHDTIRNWHPDRYEAFTGKPVPPRISHILNMRDAYRERIGRHVVTAAFGSWADWVPEGKTGIIARRLTGVDQFARPTYAEGETTALVDADAYERRGDVITLEELDGVPC